jgi:L,D-transpeptidase ErfK/SrfK
VEPEADAARAVDRLIELGRQVASGSADAPYDAADRLGRRLLVAGWRAAGRERLGMVERQVAAGDTLGRIARRHGTPHELLVRLNPGVDPRRLAIGQRLMVLDAVTVPFRMEVRLAARRLLVWRGEVPAMACAIGIGAAGSATPSGTTRIALRVRDPEWRDPATGRVHPPRSPGNLLAGFWFGFDPGPEKRFASIGIHGWTGDDPAAWVGQAGSRGCIRMRREDLEDLWALVAQGVPVEIR